MKTSFWALVATVILPTISLAQGTAADYERSANLRRNTQNKVGRERVDSTWLADKHRCWYRVDLAGGNREYVLVDAETGKKAPLFDPAKLATALTKALGRDQSAEKLALDSFTVSDDGNVARFRAGLKAWNYDIAKDELKEVDSVPAPPTTGAPARGQRQGGPPRRDGKSPDGKWTPAIKEFNVVVGSSRVDLQACKLEYSIVSPK